MLVVYLLVVLAILGIVGAYDSNFNLNMGKRYVAFSGAAYCANPLVGKDTVNNWSCKACKDFPHVTNSTSFHGGLPDANGFVAYDSDANEVVVSFSGTDPTSIRNWIDDLDFFQTDYPLCSGCKVHRGFYQTYSSVSSEVHNLVKSYMSSHSSASLAITGHSLGAAMAAHCAADLRNLGYNPKTVYSYGMPRVGNQAFEQWYVSKLAGTFRVTHRKDPVPHLPPENWNFHHMPYEVC